MISVLSAGVAICQAIEAVREYKRKTSQDKLKANSASVPVDSQIEDELARDQVRQEANLTLAQDNLTTQQDTVIPDEVVLPKEGDTFQWSQPTFDQVISRWYKLSTPAWSYTASQNASIAAIDISKALFGITSLFDRVKRYRYWRAGVKIRLQVNSTPFHYGSLFAAIVPFYTPNEQDADPIENSVWSLSGQKCSGFLSANTGKPLELSCPYQCANEYLDITQQDDQRPFYLMVCVMNPLKVAGGASNPSLQLSIFAQFTDLKIMAPSEVTANSSSKKISKADLEQRNAQKQGTMGKVAGAVSDVASKLTQVPVIGSIASAVAPIASAVGSIFDAFGWDKPTSIAAPMFNIPRQGRGMQNATGQDSAEPLGLKFDQKLSTETKHYGLHDECTRSLPALIQTPMWCGSFTIANNQATESVFKRLWVRPYAPVSTYNGLPVATEDQRHDYLSFYSQFFKGCRGGYRYFFVFDTSSYTTARLRITFEPSNQTVASVTDGGDSFSRIVDINGATTIVLEVPYCYPSARMPVAYSIQADTPSNGQLMFSLVNPIQTNGSSSDVIFVNVFRCAADDFRFYQPHIFTKTVTYVAAGASVPTTRAKQQLKANSLVEQLNQQTVTTLGDGPKVVFDRVTEDEEIVSHNDILHRYHRCQNTTGNPPFNTLYPTSGDSYYWMTPFRAYRGAVRYCTIASTNPPEGLVLDTSANYGEELQSAGAYQASMGENDIPLEVPYNNNTRFLPLRMPASKYLDAYDRWINTKDANLTNLWASGDDFTLGLRRCPILIEMDVA